MSEETIYKELCTSYRAIDDFRRALLGFLPLASGGIIALLKEGGVAVAGSPANGNSLAPFIGVFGVVVTLGLFVFRMFRHSQVHRVDLRWRRSRASPGERGWAIHSASSRCLGGYCRAACRGHHLSGRHGGLDLFRLALFRVSRSLVVDGRGVFCSVPAHAVVNSLVGL